MGEIFAQIYNFIRAQLGLKADAASATGTAHAKLKDIKDTINVGLYSKLMKASSTVLFSASTEREYTVGSTVYTMAKTVVLGIGGQYRMSFDMKNSSTYDSYGCIFVNGVAIGTERNETDGSYVTFSEDIGVPAGATIELRIKDDGGTTWLKNFKIMGTLVSTLNGAVITD